MSKWSNVCDLIIQKELNPLALLGLSMFQVE